MILMFVPGVLWAECFLFPLCPFYWGDDFLVGEKCKDSGSGFGNLIMYATVYVVWRCHGRLRQNPVLSLTTMV